MDEKNRNSSVADVAVVVVQFSFFAIEWGYLSLTLFLSDL